MDLCILDLASLRFVRSRSRTSVTVMSGLREVLAIVDVPSDLSDREAAFRATDEALSRARLVRTDPTRGRVRARLGLYNPYTAEVSVGSIPESRSFSDFSAVILSESGVLARLEGKGAHAELVLEHRSLYPVEHTFSSLTRAYTAHRS